MPEIQIYWSPKKEPATFEVTRDDEIVFEGESCLADTLFGWGIAEFIRDEGKKPAIIISREDEIRLPRNYRLNRD